MVIKGKSKIKCETLLSSGKPTWPQIFAALDSVPEDEVRELFKYAHVADAGGPLT